jgi:RNA polymerase alpha subunit
MSDIAEATSSRFVIWKTALLDACNLEDRDWPTQLLTSHGLRSLRDFNGIAPAGLGECANRFEQILDAWDLGRLVTVWWPGGTPFLSHSVDILELSIRSANCLQNAGILTIGELAQCSKTKLLSIKNMGRKSVTEIQAKLAELKLDRPIGSRSQIAAEPQSIWVWLLWNDGPGDWVKAALVLLDVELPVAIKIP